MRVDHGTPEAVFADMDLRTGMMAPESDGDFYRESDCWKTLLRYVWHNARCMNEACAYFGFAALNVDPQYGSRMAQDELKFVRKGKFARAEKVFGLGKRAVYRDWQSLQGYTPISALLDGEQGEWLKIMKSGSGGAMSCGPSFVLRGRIFAQANGRALSGRRSRT